MTEEILTSVILKTNRSVELQLIYLTDSRSSSYVVRIIGENDYTALPEMIDLAINLSAYCQGAKRIDQSYSLDDAAKNIIADDWYTNGWRLLIRDDDDRVFIELDAGEGEASDKYHPVELSVSKRLLDLLDSAKAI
jgi:hypothetical protein